MTKIDSQKTREKVKKIWDANASFWNERMGEGNDFVNHLIWPATERLLEVKPNEEVLDIACGNGFTSRKLAKIGAKITAFDVSEKMIEIATSIKSDLNTCFA
jgi:2-polyprenyl-3-methyl-5-hydroxy-6-metoxy-1,4-benzoquinol methylase